MKNKKKETKKIINTTNENTVKERNVMKPHENLNNIKEHKNKQKN